MSWSQRRVFLRRLFGRDVGRAGLRSLLAPPRVLVICHGNILRSPMGEALLRAEFARRGLPRDRVGSAGVAAIDGMGAHPDALQVAPEFGLSLESHRARLLTSALVEQTDLFVLMDELNAAILLQRFPAVESRLVLLGAFDRERGPHGAQIPDPYGEGAGSVRASYRRIVRCVAGLVDAIEDAVRPERTGR